jgi:hypothetical protein
MTMRTLFLVPAAVLLSILSWGLYGPVLHIGQEAMGHSSLRPFICVGLAYFLVAVVVPLLVLRARSETGKWTLTGTFWSVMAGAVGAFGALGIVCAFRFGGKPVYVMPLVFGCAPVVNTLVTTIMTRTYRQISPAFLTGILLVAAGAAGVLFFKPGQPSVNALDSILGLSIRDSLLVLVSIAFTALCWGAYGPVLHKGQAAMAGSRLRPFLCVGLAYFAIAVVVPFAVLGVWVEPGQWTLVGSLWSLAAGGAGALGALGIILGFNFGGKPIYVMPLVFGGAPVVNTFTTIIKRATLEGIPPLFYLSLLLVIAGAVTVLVCAPRPDKKPPVKKPPIKKPPEKAQPAVTAHPKDAVQQEPTAPDAK